MNKRQKKKLKKRWGIFHYREYHELRKRFVDHIMKYHIDRMRNEGEPIIIRKQIILEMWKAFVKTRKFGVLTYKHLKFARNLPKEVNGNYAFGYKPNPPIVPVYARQQLPQFEPINTLEVFDNEQTSKEETC
jgi:hypothetical protein